MQPVPRRIPTHLSGVMDWITSPVESAKATWRGILANWASTEAALRYELDRLTDLRIQVPPDMVAETQEAWQKTANALSAMEVLDDDVATVRGWFQINEPSTALGQLSAVAFPIVGVAYAAAAAAAFGAAVMILNDHHADDIAARKSVYDAALAQGATPAEAAAAAAAVVPLSASATSNLVTLGLVAVALLYFGRKN